MSRPRHDVDLAPFIAVHIAALGIGPGVRLEALRALDAPLSQRCATCTPTLAADSERLRRCCAVGARP